MVIDFKTRQRLDVPPQPKVEIIDLDPSTEFVLIDGLVSREMAQRIRAMAEKGDAA